MVSSLKVLLLKWKNGMETSAGLYTVFSDNWFLSGRQENIFYVLISSILLSLKVLLIPS